MGKAPSPVQSYIGSSLFSTEKLYSPLFTPDGEFVLTVNKTSKCIHFISTSTGEYYGTLSIDIEFSIYSVCFADVPDDRDSSSSTMLLIGCRGVLLAWSYDLEDLNSSTPPIIYSLVIPSSQIGLYHISAFPLEKGAKEVVCMGVAQLEKFGKKKNNNEKEHSNSGDCLYEIHLRQSKFEQDPSSSKSRNLDFRVVFEFRNHHANIRSLYLASSDYVGIHCEKRFVVFERSKSKDGARRYLNFHSELRKDEEIMSAAFSELNLALSFPRGEIELYADYFQSSNRNVSRTFHWHPRAPSDVCLYNETMYSVGEEAVLSTWSTNSESLKPIHTLPRLATSPIIGMAISSSATGEVMICMTSKDGEVILASGTGNYKWNISGIPCNALREDSLRNFQSNSEGTAVLWTNKNQVQAYNFRKNSVSSRISISFNYLPDKASSCPKITHFCEFGEWLVASVVSSSDFGPQETLHFYKNQELHSLVPRPHSQSNTIDAMSVCERQSTLVTASIGEGVIKRWDIVTSSDNAQNKQGWRCTSKFQFGSVMVPKSGIIRLSLCEDILCVAVGNSVQVWDHSRGILLKRLSCQANRGIKLSNADLFTVSSKAIQMWNLCTGRKWGFSSDGLDTNDNTEVCQAVWNPKINEVCLILRENSSGPKLLCLLDANNGNIINKFVWNKTDPIRCICSAEEHIYALTKNGTMLQIGNDRRKLNQRASIAGQKRKELNDTQITVPKLDLPVVLESNSKDQSISWHKFEAVSSSVTKKQRSVELPVLSRGVLRGFL